MSKGAVVWFTGHSKSGKTTLTKMVDEKLKQMGYRSFRLDSDTLPISIIKPNASTWEERQKLKNENLIYLSELLYEHGDIVLIASVGRFRCFREKMREKMPQLIEIYLECSLEERLQRDSSGKYKTHSDYFHFYEEPKNPNLIIDTEKMTELESVSKIIFYMQQEDFIK